MKITKIAPEHVYLKIEEAHAGNLDTSMRESAVENGEVVMIGEGIDWLKKGDKVMFKSWGVDLINVDGKRYCFLDMKSRAIKAIYG